MGEGRGKLRKPVPFRIVVLGCTVVGYSGRFNVAGAIVNPCGLVSLATAQQVVGGIGGKKIGAFFLRYGEGKEISPYDGRGGAPNLLF